MLLVDDVSLLLNYVVDVLEGLEVFSDDFERIGSNERYDPLSRHGSRSSRTSSPQVSPGEHMHPNGWEGEV
jgi:hypothetical protein